MIFQSSTSFRFRKLLEGLPDHIQGQAIKQYALFCEDPFHPSLHLKSVGDFWAVRVSRSYRALAIRTDDSFVWFWIGHHDEYEQILKSR